jgi:PAS domain S-box-containing protein
MGDTLGVLLFLPLVMLVAGEPRGVWRARARPVALPMVLFFALFVGIFIKVSRWEYQQSLLEFRLSSQQMIDDIHTQLGAQEAFLEQLAASFNGPAQLSRDDFNLRARALLARFPVIQAIEWAPRVLARDRETFEAAQQHGQPGFAIREQDGVGAQRLADNRLEYFPVTYIEPLRGNRAALGFDLLSDPGRRAAVLHTLNTGSISASAPIRLGHAPGDVTGLLLTLAVPQGSSAQGVVLTAMRMGTLIASLPGAADGQIGIQLIDREVGIPLFDSLVPLSDSLVRDQDITFGGRTYRIRIAPTPLYFAQHRGWQSLALLSVGVLSTSLLGALLMLTTGERQRFARLLSERTRERDRIWQVSEDLLGVGNFEGYFLSVNPAWTHTLGWTEAEIKTIHVNDLRHPDDFDIGTDARRRLAEGVGTVRMENRFRHKDGSYRWIYWTMTAEQGLIYVIGRNVTADREAALARQEIEEQLRQSQKMESVGQLTGGIAHDFNNLLTIVIGNLQILERTLGSTTDKVHRAVTAAMSGATRAATLTQRLLAYAQKQPLRPRAVNLNELVMGMADLIRRTQGEMIQYDFSLGGDVPNCFCDANQLETALLNLVINARDAMQEGGSLKIETGRAVFDHPDARTRALVAGTYALLAVSDTGVGMSPQTAARAFEPFFTTKPVSKGTGLGLSMVYGFVKQSKGHVEIDSTLGHGTTVRLYLPSLSVGDTQDLLDPMDVSPIEPAAVGREETILVVEDDMEVRRFVADALHELNYRVIEVEGADAALQALSRNDLPIDLLLTDVVMPGLNGRELAIRATATRRNIRVLFMTGYSQDTIVHQGRLDPDVALIEKPFRREILAAAVRRSLDSRIAGRGAMPGDEITGAA